MADDRLDVLLSVLERPVVPDASFADRLFDELVEGTGLRRRTGGPRWRLRLLVGPDQATAYRLAWVAIIGALLLTLLAVLSGVGSKHEPFAVAPPRATSTSAAGTSLPTAAASFELPDPRIASGVMDVGAPAPRWSGTQLDGSPFSTDDLAGRPAALFIWCTCIRGPEVRLFLETAAARAGELTMVLVSTDAEGTTRGLVDWLHVTTPVVLDPTMNLLATWQIQGFPALVLLRPDGTLAGIQAPTSTGRPLP